jgi:hypothetical protein
MDRLEMDSKAVQTDAISTQLGEKGIRSAEYTRAGRICCTLALDGARRKKTEGKVHAQCARVVLFDNKLALGIDFDRAEEEALLAFAFFVAVRCA